MARKLTTKSGHTLTEADIERLAGEAERGFGLSDWVPSPGGRRPIDVETVTLTKSFYSPAEVAQLASVSSSTILNYIRSGRLAAVRLSARKYRIPRKSIMLLLGLPTTPPRFTSDPDAEVDL